MTEPTEIAPNPDGLPHRDAVASTSDLAPLDLARRIVELAEDKKAADIVLLDLFELTTLADAFVICSGGSERQISAIADGILDLCRLAVVPRADHAALDATWVRDHLPGREDRVRFLPGPLLPISGSVVRRRARAGRSVRYLVPDAVAAYIAQHRLYA